MRVPLFNFLTSNKIQSMLPKVYFNPFAKKFESLGNVHFKAQHQRSVSLKQKIKA